MKGFDPFFAWMALSTVAYYSWMVALRTTPTTPEARDRIPPLPGAHQRRPKVTSRRSSASTQAPGRQSKAS